MTRTGASAGMVSSPSSSAPHSAPSIHTRPTPLANSEVVRPIRPISRPVRFSSATISGSVMGAFCAALLPRFTRELPEYVPFLSASATETPNVFQFETLLYGLLIVLFLIFEPRGLFGVWIRIRNYWKAWPFSY